ENGRRMGATDDGDARYRCGVASHHMGRRLSLWTAHRFRRGQFRPLRDQCQFGLSYSRPSAGCHRATDLGEAPSERRQANRAASAGELTGGASVEGTKEYAMRVLPKILFGMLFIASASAACGEEINWGRIDETLGRKAAVASDDVHRYGFPRADLN